MVSMERLSDEQWERIREHSPEENLPESRPGGKPVPARAVLEAVLWMLNTGAQWYMLAQCYPNHKTVHRRFRQWRAREVLRDILTRLANELRDQGGMDETECFIDATFASAQGGGEGMGKTRRGKGVKILAIVDRHGLPLSVSTHAANHHEVTLVQLRFDFSMIEAKPQHLVGDKASDGDARDDALKQDGIEMIAPHRSNRTLKTQDGRRLRTLRTTVAGRALFCMVAVEASVTGALGVLRQQLSRLRPARQHYDAAQAILR
jgi:transposase